MIVSNRHPIIAQEGWLFIGVCIGLLIISLYIAIIVSPILLFLTIFLVYVYRDPQRKIPSAPLGLVSPIDGRIVSLDEVTNRFTGEESYRIGIMTNKLGVFALRSPIEGKMHKQFFDKSSGKSHYINWVQTDEGDNVIWEVNVKARTGSHCYVQPGERIGHGQRCGFLAFNSYVNLYVPLNSSLSFKLQESVLAGEDILASLVHNQGASIVVKTA